MGFILSLMFAGTLFKTGLVPFLESPSLTTVPKSHSHGFIYFKIPPEVNSGNFHLPGKCQLHLGVKFIGIISYSILIIKKKNGSVLNLSNVHPFILNVVYPCLPLFLSFTFFSFVLAKSIICLHGLFNDQFL